MYRLVEVIDRWRLWLVWRPKNGRSRWIADGLDDKCGADGLRDKNEDACLRRRLVTTVYLQAFIISHAGCDVSFDSSRIKKNMLDAVMVPVSSKSN